MRRAVHLVVLISALFIPPRLPAQFVNPAQKARFNAVDRDLEKSSPEQRVAFNALVVAFTAFRDARIAHEMCFSNRPCGETPAQEAEKLTASFLSLIEGTSSAASSTLSADDLTIADAALNRVFDDTVAALPESCSISSGGCLSQSAFRETQRDWIRFRDAYLIFATLRWPKTSPDTWKTLLTRERTTQISRLPKP